MPKEYTNEEKIDEVLKPSIELREPIVPPSILSVIEGGTGSKTGSIRGVGSLKIETTQDPAVYIDDSIPSILIQGSPGKNLGDAGGTIKVVGGIPADTGMGGGVYILGGDGNPISTLSDGGSVTVKGGGGFLAGDGGNVDIIGGLPGTTGLNAGYVKIQGGSGNGAVANGGSVYLQSGAGTGGGAEGFIVFRYSGNGDYAVFTGGLTSTTNATATDIFTLTLGTSTTITIEAFVTATRTGGTAGTDGDSAGYIFSGTYKRGSVGGATIVGSITAIHTAEDQAAWDATFTTSGNNLSLTITGALNNNIRWGWHVKYLAY